jgi:hypothetical protein
MARPDSFSWGRVPCSSATGKVTEFSTSFPDSMGGTKATLGYMATRFNFTAAQVRAHCVC